MNFQGVVNSQIFEEQKAFETGGGLGVTSSRTVAQITLFKSLSSKILSFVKSSVDEVQ